MPAVALHSLGGTSSRADNTFPNPLPALIQTPSGLAILEIQGTIHAPFPAPRDGEPHNDDHQTPVGRLEFPLFRPGSDPHDLKWMKKVYLYVGRHQRLAGEVKKMPKPLVVLAKRSHSAPVDNSSSDRATVTEEEELEILEVVKHKIIFGGRPEPVGDTS